MIYHVIVRPCGEEVANAIIELPSLKMFVNTDMSGSQLKEFLNKVRPSRWVTINEVKRRYKKAVDNALTLGEAVDTILKESFNVVVSDTYCKFSAIGKFEDKSHTWAAWDSSYNDVHFHFFRFIAKEDHTDYENKMFRCYGTYQIAKSLYDEFDIELSSGNDCLFFVSDKYFVSREGDFIVISEVQEVTEHKNITV